MKKILTAIALLITVVCSSQTKDTTKKEPIRYFLIGELPAWQLLFKAVNEPGKVTRDEISMLSQWINNIRELQTDTTKQKK